MSPRKQTHRYTWCSSPFRSSFFLFSDLQELIISPLLVATSIIQSKTVSLEETFPFNILHWNYIYCSVHLNEWWLKTWSTCSMWLPKHLECAYKLCKDKPVLKPSMGSLRTLKTCLRMTPTPNLRPSFSGFQLHVKHLPYRANSHTTSYSFHLYL